MFKFIKFILKFIVLSVIILPFVLLGYSLSNTALVSNRAVPEHHDIARVQQILKQHDPRHLKQGQTGYLILSEQDINALLVGSFSFLNSYQNQKMPRVQAASLLHDKHLSINVSIRLPENQWAHFINFSLGLKTSAKDQLQIDKVSFGTLTIPGFLIQPVWDFSNQYFYQFSEYQQLVNALQKVELSPQQLSLIYTADWEAVKQLKQRGQSLLISESEKKTIRLYQQELSQISKQLNRKVSREVSYQKGQPSLSKVLQPLFQFALTRSSTSGVSAVAENKALLFVLAMHASGKNINSIIGEASEQQNSSSKIKLKSTLRMRHDLMQHFSISAFLSSVAGDALAHATGIFKEMSDSQGGSGFSFADLAADQAGVKFGAMAVASESSALSLQQFMSRISNENDYMPRINNLPEGLQEGRFKRQYGTTKDTRYKQVQKELDKRIRLCRLYKDN